MSADATLADAWRDRLAYVVDAVGERGDEAGGRRGARSIARSRRSIRSTMPHRAIDWLSTYPQAGLIASGRGREVQDAAQRRAQDRVRRHPGRPAGGPGRGAARRCHARAAEPRWRRHERRDDEADDARMMFPTCSAIGAPRPRTGPFRSHPGARSGRRARRADPNQFRGAIDEEVTERLLARRAGAGMSGVSGGSCSRGPGENSSVRRHGRTRRSGRGIRLQVGPRGINADVLNQLDDAGRTPPTRRSDCRSPWSSSNPSAPAMSAGPSDGPDRRSAGHARDARRAGPPPVTDRGTVCTAPSASGSTRPGRMVVRASTLLRYAQDLAWSILPSVGSTERGTLERGLTWLARAVAVAVLAAIVHGDDRYGRPVWSAGAGYGLGAAPNFATRSGRSWLDPCRLGPA